jgi:hypothetical protein
MQSDMKIFFIVIKSIYLLSKNIMRFSWFNLTFKTMLKVFGLR